MNLCTSVSRVHQKSFKLNLKGERDKITNVTDKPEGSIPKFEGWYTIKVLRSAISVEVRGGDPGSSKDARIIYV